MSLLAAADSLETPAFEVLLSSFAMLAAVGICGIHLCGVREKAAEQNEERQSDWAYSKPVVILDLIWNAVFITVSVAILILSRDEKTTVPLRLWIIGYGVQCIVHMVCVCVEYSRRRELRQGRSGGDGWENGGN
ncbi:hypothetical protein Ancab_016907 [Ancistrocladus abbreviatus]